MSYNTSTYAGKEQVVSDYKSAVENDPFLTFKSFCDQNGIAEYKPLLWWCNRQGISINKIQSAARGSNKSPLAEVGKNLETSFLQFVPQSAGDANRIRIWMTCTHVNLQLGFFSKAICLSVMFITPRMLISLCMPTPQPLYVKKIMRFRNDLSIFAHARSISMFCNTNILKINDMGNYYVDFYPSFIIKSHLRNLSEMYCFKGNKIDTTWIRNPQNKEKAKKEETIQ